MSMQIKLMLLSQQLQPGQCIVIVRDDMIKAAAGSLTSLLFDSVRESDIDNFARKIEQSWGITMSCDPMTGNYTMCKPT